MELQIDRKSVLAQPGESLLELVQKLHLDTCLLSSRPLAAQIAGETFTLNYVPVRVDGQRVIRRAMEASAGNIRLLRYKDVHGRQVYERTALFVLFLAVRQLWPKAVAKMNFTVGGCLQITIEKAPAFSGEDVSALRESIQRIVASNIPLLRGRMATLEAVRFSFRVGHLLWREKQHFLSVPR